MRPTVAAAVATTPITNQIVRLIVPCGVNSANVVARNQDDHVKNIAFLMNKAGEWSLSPAFDMTYSFNPTGAWTASHQMTMNGKRDNFTMEDFNACARTASMKRGRAAKILAEVQATVAKWQSFAEKAGAPDVVREQIQRTLNLKAY